MIALSSTTLKLKVESYEVLKWSVMAARIPRLYNFITFDLHLRAWRYA